MQSQWMIQVSPLDRRDGVNFEIFSEPKHAELFCERVTAVAAEARLDRPVSHGGTNDH